MDAGQGSDEPVPDQEGNDHHAAGRRILVLVASSVPRPIIRDDQRFVGLRDLPHRALAEAHSGADRVGPDVVARDDLEHSVIFIEDRELSARDLEQ